MKNKNRLLRHSLGLVVLLSALATPEVKASLFTLPQVDTSMTDPIFKTLASGLSFRPLEPASDLGRLWGFYIGTEFSGTSASAVSNIFSGLPSSSYFPSADLQVGVGLPFGLTVELGMVPSVSYSGTSFAKYAGAVKWTATRTAFPKFPLDIALQLAYTNATLSYSQPLNGGTVNVNYKTGVVAANLLVSKAFGFGISAEPYGGIGLVNQSSSLDGSGTVSLFGSSFPAGTQSVSTSGMAAWLEAGLLVKLGFLGITGEYDYQFGLSSYNMKLSLRF